jgi:hypothetical protein
MMALVLLFVLVPFFFWHGTWFGRPLSEEEIGRHLADSTRPRKTQHALTQIGERILRGDPAVRRWYPAVQALADHQLLELRAMAAWVMGQDNQSPEFHATLTRMLADLDPMVRRNAALSLVRFADASGRPELIHMLRPYQLAAPVAGRLQPRLTLDDVVNPGTLLARIARTENEVFEIRSPLPGTLEAWLAAANEEVQAGQPILRLAPAPEQVWEALRALYLVGEEEDLADVERYARGVFGMPERIQQQAALTAAGIRSRLKPVN